MFHGNYCVPYPRYLFVGRGPPKLIRPPHGALEFYRAFSCANAESISNKARVRLSLNIYVAEDPASAQHELRTPQAPALSRDDAAFPWFILPTVPRSSCSASVCRRRERSRWLPQVSPEAERPLPKSRLPACALVSHTDSRSPAPRRWERRARSHQYGE